MTSHRPRAVLQRLTQSSLRVFADGATARSKFLSAAFRTYAGTHIHNSVAQAWNDAGLISARTMERVGVDVPMPGVTARGIPLPLELHPNTTYSFTGHINRNYPSYLTITYPSVNFDQFRSAFPTHFRQHHEWMDKPAPHRIERSTLADQQIEMSARTGIYGADRSTFVGCEILLLPKGLPAARFGERFDIGFAKFERCAFRARGTIKKLHLTVRTQLIDCRFEGGPFEAAEFGQKLPPGAPLDGWSSSSIQRCDFRNAELHDACFYSAAIDQVKLPGWPHITLLSPHATDVAQPEPHILVSLSAKRDSIWYAMEFISDALERMKAVGPPSIRVMHVHDMVPERELQGTFREMLDKLGHPRIRY